jgi:hypothetical protein
MADWLPFLLRLVGNAGLIAAASFIVGKWLWGKIDKALEGYSSAYASGQAAIDVRIRNLEKLAEEQARLTRTVETIKDEIATQRKSHDNRWEFRKDVYAKLITATSGMIRASSGIVTEIKLATELAQTKTPATDPRFTGHVERLKSEVSDQKNHGELFATYVSLSPLAVAEDVVPLVTTTWDQLKDLHLSSPELVSSSMPKRLEALADLLRKLQTAGRKDLWGDSELEPKATVASQNT